MNTLLPRSGLNILKVGEETGNRTREDIFGYDGRVYSNFNFRRELAGNDLHTIQH